MKTGVTFPNKEVEKEYEALALSKDQQQRQLHKHITNTIEALKEHPKKGKKIPKRLWPKEYVQQYSIDNLWKIDLPRGWRLIYTFKAGTAIILTVILEWMKHKDYEKRFDY